MLFRSPWGYQVPNWGPHGSPCYYGLYDGLRSLFCNSPLICHKQVVPRLRLASLSGRGALQFAALATCMHVLTTTLWPACFPTSRPALTFWQLRASCWRKSIWKFPESAAKDSVDDRPRALHSRLPPQSRNKTSLSKHPTQASEVWPSSAPVFSAVAQSLNRKARELRVQRSIISGGSGRANSVTVVHIVRSQGLL